MLNTRVIRNGALLLSLGTGLSAAIKFVSVPVLARLLTPEEFGIAGTALVLVSFATILSGGSGLGTAITYFKDKREDYDHTVVWSALLLGISFAVLCWTFSATLARAWGAVEAAPYIRMVAVFFPCSVMAGVGYALLARDFSFKTITVINVIASILSATTSVSMAFSGFGAWSLIAQYSVFNGVKCIGYLSCSGYRPAWNITFGRIRDIFPFTYRLTLAEMLMWGSSEGPFILVTTKLGVPAGGAYRIFQRFTALPREAIGENLSKAAYVGMADTTAEGARAGFLWSTKTSAYLQGAVFLWLAALSEPLTKILLGSQYADQWPLASAMALGLAAQSHGNMAMPFLKAAGRTKAVLWLSLMRTTMILTGAWTGLTLTGTLLGSVSGAAVTMAMAALVFLTFVTFDQDLKFKELVDSVWRPMVFTSLTGAVAFTMDQSFADQFSGPLAEVWRVLFGSLLGATVYALLIRIFAPQDIGPLIGGLRGLRKKGKS